MYEGLAAYLTSSGWTAEEGDAWTLRLTAVPCAPAELAENRLDSFEGLRDTLFDEGWQLSTFWLDVTGTLIVVLQDREGNTIGLSSDMDGDLNTLLTLRRLPPMAGNVMPNNATVAR